MKADTDTPSMSFNLSQPMHGKLPIICIKINEKINVIAFNRS